METYKKKRYLIDIGHPAHVNFFKYVIHQLSLSDDVYISYLDRGSLSAIVKREFGQHKLFCVGKHLGTKYSIIVHANIVKFINIVFIILRWKIDIGINGGVPGGLALRLFGRKYIQFDDDYERITIVRLEKLLAHELCFPSYISERSNVSTFNALKEWAYLSPQYFKPTASELVKLGLVQKEYIFIREVSTGSYNYFEQKSALMSELSKKLTEKYKVVLSLEDKSLSSFYPESWIILSEPVDDIHSLMYYSKYVISTGDSMAREGAMLGVPSIYCGYREMHANKFIQKQGILLKVPPNEVPGLLVKLDEGRINHPSQDAIRNDLSIEWIDVNNYILSKVYYIKENK